MSVRQPRRALRHRSAMGLPVGSHIVPHSPSCRRQWFIRMATFGRSSAIGCGRTGASRPCSCHNDILCLTSRAPSRPTVTVTRRIKSRPFEQLLHRAGQLPVFLNENDVTGAIILSTCVSSCVCFGSASAGHCIRVLALGWFRSLAEGWDASGFM
ncbi:uncharacterized protein [Lolium perenne]|uniref:uncharacterized protein n=1 Tax=Lolium perenne TaxID=4522 RepID=UPI0021F57CBA|nr:uncharacterized protein LOC127297417 isoform X2 [Lolium perenne]